MQVWGKVSFLSITTKKIYKKIGLYKIQFCTTFASSFWYWETVWNPHLFQSVDLIFETTVTTATARLQLQWNFFLASHYSSAHIISRFWYGPSKTPEQEAAGHQLHRCKRSIFPCNRNDSAAMHDCLQVRLPSAKQRHRTAFLHSLLFISNNHPSPISTVSGGLCCGSDWKQFLSLTKSHTTAWSGLYHQAEHSSSKIGSRTQYGTSLSGLQLFGR